MASSQAEEVPQDETLLCLLPKHLHHNQPLRMKAFFVLLGMDIENKGYILPLE